MAASANNSPLQSPVLFIIFNRPETTRQVFAAIRKAQPKRLYIAADGSRKNKPGEIEKCEEARRIASAVDWDCEVKFLFREDNLGCGKGPVHAINWFFEHETEGIILEDDCLPSPTFFTFCSELLARYRDDTRVMEIGGNNLEKTTHRDEDFSYRFSNHAYIWGWATWRRAWKLNDFDMSYYKEIKRKKYLKSSFDSIYERDFYDYVFGKMSVGDERISSRTIWDYQWQFACKINSGLVIVPNRNLVVNLGFGLDATNTVNPEGPGHDLILEDMNFPLRHPEFMMVDIGKDREVFKEVGTSMSSRVKSRIKHFLPRPLIENIVRPMMSLFALSAE